MKLKIKLAAIVLFSVIALGHIAMAIGYWWVGDKLHASLTITDAGVASLIAWSLIQDIQIDELQERINELYAEDDEEP